jgi:hypothetical protein
MVKREAGGGVVVVFEEEGLVADFFIDSPFLGVAGTPPEPARQRRIRV